MTTIAAIAVDDAVVMAADGLTMVYDRKVPGAWQKIVRVKAGDDDVLLGFAGAAGLKAAADAVKVDAAPDPTDEQDVQRWATAIAHGLNDWAREVGILNEGRMDGHVLLAWRGRVWTIADSCALPMPDGRAAIGSGEELATGALDALADHTNLNPTEIVMRALAIACARDPYSGMPIQVELLTPPEPGDVDGEEHR